MLIFFSIVFSNFYLSYCSAETLYELSPCSTANSFHHYFGITVDDCKVRCHRRKNCAAINYNNYIKHCALRNSTGLPLKGSEPQWCYDVIVNNDTMWVDGPCKERPCNETEICMGSYRAPFFRCVIGYCKTDTDIPNTSFRSNMMRPVGSKNELVCDKGYTPRGKTSVSCLHNGNWSTTNFECLKNCPSIPVISSAIVSSWSTYRFVQNTTVDFICKEGFYNITEREIVCDSTDTWSEFECLPYCRQADIIPVTNGSPISGNVYTIYEQAEYECNKGHYLSPGSRFVTCDDKGTWSQPEVACYAFCYQDEIPKVENGTPLPGKLYNYSMTAKYACNQGHYLSDGSPEITCGKDGKWATPQVECYTFCQLPTVTNGVLQETPIQPIKKDVSVKYTCNSGYYTHPSVSQPTAVCKITGEWVYSAECYKYCSGAPDHQWEKVTSYSTGAPYTVATTVHYTCGAPLMHFSGGNTKSCHRDGWWDREVHCCFTCFNYRDGKCRCDCFVC